MRQPQSHIIETSVRGLSSTESTVYAEPDIESQEKTAMTAGTDGLASRQRFMFNSARRAAPCLIQRMEFFLNGQDKLRRGRGPEILAD